MKVLKSHVHTEVYSCKWNTVAEVQRKKMQVLTEDGL